MSSKLLDHPKALCNQIRRLALEAGALTLNYFDEAGCHSDDVEAKKDGSPVTIADQEAEALIEKGLADILPDVPFVGEEATAAGRVPALSGAEYSWRVDALDGTKGFVHGEPFFTVNIALVHNGEPVIGVVFAPALGELYAGCGAGTAVFWSEETGKEKSIQVRKPDASGLVVVASRRHGDMSELDSYLAGHKVRKILKRDSSLKICAIAAGKADLYPRLGPTCEWDTAAAHAVLLAAGGTIVDLEGKPLTYSGADPKFKNPKFIASGGEVL